MPKHSLTLPWDKFRGKISLEDRNTGLVLYDGPHCANVSRQLVTPRNPRSAQQVLTRGNLAATASAWTGLTTAQAASWNALAAQISRTNCLGYYYTLTGISTFNMVNTYRLLADLTITTAPPDLGELPPPISGIIDFASAPPIALINLDCTAIPDNCLVFFRVTPSIATEARLLRPGELRMPYADHSDCFGTVTAGLCSWIFEPDLTRFVGGEYCGAEFTALSAAYLPRLSQFWPHQYIEPL